MDPSGKYSAIYYYSSGIYNLRIFPIPNGNETQISQLWNITVSNVAEFSFSTRDSRFLVTDFNNNFTRLYNLPSSTPAWQISINTVHSNFKSSLNEYGSLAVIYTISALEDKVFLLNGTNGNTIWQRTFSGFSIVDIAISDLNNVFIGLNNNTILKVDSSNTTIWTQDYADYISNIRISRNESIVLGYNGMNRIARLNPNTGSIMSQKLFTNSYY